MTNNLKNYRPISLLLFFSKVFEKIFNKMCFFFQNEQLLNRNQSGFHPSDSCINQLLSITHKIFQSFDSTLFLEVRSVFLDISKKAFDKVWYEGLLCKLNPIGISGKFYKLIEIYLSNRFQRVVLNGQTSSWRPVFAGIPLHFLIYVNNMPNGLKSNVRLLFADDTYIFSIAKNKNGSAKDLTHDISLISKWAFKWKMLFNLDPTKPALEVIFSAHPNIFFNNIQVERASYKNILEYILTKN